MSAKTSSFRRDTNEAENGKPAASADWSAIIGRHSMMLALEPRFMFDASVADTSGAAESAAEPNADPTSPDADGEDGQGGESGQKSGAGGADGDGVDDPYAKPGDRPDEGAGLLQAFGIGVQAEGGMDGGARAPTIVKPGGVTATENETFDFSGAGLEIKDLDGPNEIIVTLTVENGTLSFASRPSGVEIVSENNMLNWDSKSATFTISGDPNSVKQALAYLQYTPDEYYSGSDTLKIDVEYALYNEANDAFSGYTEGYLATETVAITITDVNHPAEIDIGSGNLITIDEDTWGQVTGVSVIDRDRSFEHGDQVTVELKVGSGELGYADSGSPDGYGKYTPSHYDSGTGIRTYTFSGSRDEVNEILGSLYYKGNQDAYGTDTLTITAWDEYWTSSDGAKATADVEIRVTPVPDAPEIDFEGNRDNPDFLTATAEENNAGGVRLTADMFLITDVDTGTALQLVQIMELPAHGTLYRVSGNGTRQALGVGDRFSMAELDPLSTTKIIYVHNDSGGQVRDDVSGGGFYSTDSFSFVVTDGAGNYVTGGTDGTDGDKPRATAVQVDEGGVLVDASQIGFTLKLTSVNDPIEVKPGGDKSRTETSESGDPEVENSKTLAVYEGEDGAVIQFGIVDPDQKPGVGHIIYITELPVDGTLYWNGVEIKATPMQGLDT